MLAGHLKMTVGELEQRMDSRELSEWLAFSRFFQPLDNPWATTGVLASAVLAPHVGRGHQPSPKDFIPIERPPQHRTKMQETLLRMKQELDGK